MYSRMRSGLFYITRKVSIDLPISYYIEDFLSCEMMFYYLPNDGLMLVQRLRIWPNIKTIMFIVASILFTRYEILFTNSRNIIKPNYITIIPGLSNMSIQCQKSTVVCKALQNVQYGAFHHAMWCISSCNVAWRKMSDSHGP